MPALVPWRLELGLSWPWRDSRVSTTNAGKIDPTKDGESFLLLVKFSTRGLDDFPWTYLHEQFRSWAFFGAFLKCGRITQHVRNFRTTRRTRHFFPNMFRNSPCCCRQCRLWARFVPLTLEANVLKVCLASLVCVLHAFTSTV